MKVIIDLKLDKTRVTQTIYCDKSEKEILQVFKKIIELSDKELKP